MRWLILIAAVVAAVLALQILLMERRGGRPRSTVTQFASAILPLVVLGGAAYAAHSMGLFSLPLVAIAFVPFGIAARWFVMATRDARRRREALTVRPPLSRRARVLELAAWPVFLVLVAVVLTIGLVVGMLVGPH